MKNLKFFASLLILTLACVTFTSCSDDDKDEPNATNVEGVWICTESTYAPSPSEDITEDDDLAFTPFAVGDGMKRRMVINLCKQNKNLTFADINKLQWKRIRI